MKLKVVPNYISRLFTPIESLGMEIQTPRRNI